MTFLSWRRDYEVGAAQIDAEHHGLFDLVNAFHDMHARGDSRREAARALNRLIAYAEEHFQHEEKLMRENDYPLLDKHRELHSDLVTSIFAINERLAAETTEGSAVILPFIRNWLVQHIIKHDLDIGEFLRRKAIHANKALQDAQADRPEEDASSGAVQEPRQ